MRADVNRRLKRCRRRLRGRDGEVASDPQLNGGGSRNGGGAPCWLRMTSSSPDYLWKGIVPVRPRAGLRDVGTMDVGCKPCFCVYTYENILPDR